MNKVFLLALGTLISVSAFAGPAKPKKEKLEKIPKSLFLVKKSQIGVDVGEPQLYPGEAQLRMIINDPLLHDVRRFE